MAAQKKAIRFLACLICMLLISINMLAGPAYGASFSNVTVSNKNGKDGLADYPDGSVHYILPRDRLRLVRHEAGVTNQIGHVNVQNADVTFQKKVNGSWTDSNNTPFDLFTTTEEYNGGNSLFESDIWFAEGIGGTWGSGGKTYSDYRIRIVFPDAAMKYDGTYHDVTMTVSNIFLRANDGSTVDGFAFITQDSSGYLHFSSSRMSLDDPDVGVAFDVNISVSGAAAHEAVFLAFRDLDQEGFDGMYNANFPNGCVEGIQIKSGLFPSSQPHLSKDTILRVEDGSRPAFYATGPTDADDQYKAGMSYLGTANDTTFRWGGHTCGTGFGMPTDVFPNVLCDTQVQIELASSSVSGTKTYGSYFRADSKRYMKIMPIQYWYNYTYSSLMGRMSLTSPADDWIFSKPSLGYWPVGSTNITQDTTFYISIDRNRYTYSFYPNPPAGKSAADVSGMPANKTVVATKDPSGKSDATVSSPALAGYKFKGWNTDPAGSGSGYPGAETMKFNKSFYATWEPATYKVHFNANGSSNPNHETGEFTQNTTTGTMADQTLQFDTPANLNANTYARAGYTFAGWNTKPDGTGTSYSNGQSVTNLIAYGQTEITLYAQWAKQLGMETITVVSEETGNRVSSVSMKLQKNVNGTWVDVTTGTTNSSGQITVNNLHWFNYRWVMTGVPAGYVKSADTAFTINYNQLSATNQVILYMKHVTIILDSQVSDIIKGEQAPAFLYHISGTDVAGVAHEYDILVQTNTSSKFGSSRASGLFAGTYIITQTPVSRYNAETAVNISNGTANGINASVNVKDYDSAEIRFPYTVKEYGWYYGVNSRINRVV